MRFALFDDYSNCNNKENKQRQQQQQTKTTATTTLAAAATTKNNKQLTTKATKQPLGGKTSPAVVSVLKKCRLRHSETIDSFHK